MKAARLVAVRSPIFWLFLGPPILRLSARDPLASVEGSLDPWNLLRVAWWGAVGLWTIWELVRYRRYIPLLWRPAAAPLAFGFAWVAAMFVSVAVSPSVLLSTVQAGLMAILLLAAVDLSVKVAAGFLSVEEVLRRMLHFSVALLGLVLILWLIAPGTVSGSHSTWPPGRLTGSTVAGTHFLAVIVLLVAGYFVLTGGLRRALPYLAALPLAAMLLLLSQTRTGYIQAALGALSLLAFWLPTAGKSARRAMLATALIAAGSGVLAIAAAEARQQEPLATAWSYLVRDERTLLNASGRDGIITILGREALANPLGLGYVAGPRNVLQDPGNETEFWYEYGVLPGSIGDAHNMYLEVYAGTGVLGFVLFAAMLAGALLLSTRTVAPGSIAVRALLVVVLVGGLTASAGALPLNQASTLLMILLGTIVGSSLWRRAW